MRVLVVFAIFVFGFAPLAQAHGPLVVKASPHSVAVTLDRLAAVLEKKGVTVFARIDHAAGAQSIGATLRPTQVLIFGNPKLGTPLMQSVQMIGLDLPLKALAWQDEAGKVWLAYTKPAVLAQRFHVADRPEIVKKITGALDKLTNAALKP